MVKLEWCDPSEAGITVILMIDGKVAKCGHVAWDELADTCINITLSNDNVVPMEDCGLLSIAEHIEATMRPVLA